MELVLVVVAIAGVGAAVLLALRRSAGGAAPAGGGDVAGSLHQVAQAVQALQTQTAVLAEKVGGVSERVGLLEQHQGGLRDGLAKLDSGLAQTTTLTTGLREATESIRGELAKAREGLTDLQSSAQARQALEQQTARSIRRLEQVMAGTAAKGAAGENVIDLIFARLPVDWQVRDFRVGNRSCEFGLRLPNGLVMPIDSKWPATPLLEEFLAEEDPFRQQQLKTQIERTVLEKAREVTKYLDPELTWNYGLAVVPDAVFELCAGVQAECMKHSVVLVAHSMLVPYLLLVFQTVLRSSRDVDLEALGAQLEVAEGSLRSLQEEIEGRFSRALTMLDNSRAEMRVHAGRAAQGLTAVQLRAAVVETEEQFVLPEGVSEQDEEGVAVQ